MQVSSKEKRFQVVNLISILVLFVLILAGGVVRSTGSGMGCPDWPKCFDQFVPPTNISQLPSDYKERFVERRFQKNQKFAKTLDFFGYGDLAARIRHDQSILIPEDFNAAKTWTEYVNRLLGAITGFLLIFTAVLSFVYRKIKSRIFYWSLFNILLVAFQGWLGSIVVSTNLVAWIVTIHMLLALAVLAISIYTYHQAKSLYAISELKSKLFIRITALVAFITSIVQITIGTEVREEIDAISDKLHGEFREDWVGSVGDLFHDHRELAIWIFVINVVLYGMIRKNFTRQSLQQQIMSFSFLMVIIQIFTGYALSNWSLPPFAQAAHILFSSLIFGAQFYLILNLKNRVKSFAG